MSFHIFKEDSITPSTRSINMRNVVDSSGPHKLTFGIRTVVADPAAGVCSMYCSYETPNGQIRSIELTSPADLKTITDSGGAMWYSPDVLVIDERHPLGNGALSDPYGNLSLEFFVGAGVAGTSKISYEAILEVFDASPAVVYHP